jgi:hypothetical protein
MRGDTKTTTIIAIMLQVANQSGTRFLSDFDFLFDATLTGGVKGVNGIEWCADERDRAGPATPTVTEGNKLVACSEISGASPVAIALSGRVSCDVTSNWGAKRLNWRCLDVCRSENTVSISFPYS